MQEEAIAAEIHIDGLGGEHPGKQDILVSGVNGDGLAAVAAIGSGAIGPTQFQLRIVARQYDA